VNPPVPSHGSDADQYFCGCRLRALRPTCPLPAGHIGTRRNVWRRWAREEPYDVSPRRGGSAE
jgi:hypothetical protein